MFVTNERLSRLLLDMGADPCQLCPWGDSPLSFAARYSDPQIVEMLVGNAQSRGLDLSVGELAHCALDGKSEARDLKVLHILASHGVPLDRIPWDTDDTKIWFTRGTPSHRAVKLGNADIVAFLLDNGANPHKKQMKKGRETGWSVSCRACVPQE